jgi:hypothetical protein
MERITLIKKCLSLKPQRIEWFNHFTNLTDGQLIQAYLKLTNQLN